MSSLFKNLDGKIKRYKLDREQRYYEKKYGAPVNLQQYILRENKYSGRPLNILYLVHMAEPFAINNTLRPLESFGHANMFELDPAHDRKNWYCNKSEKNRKMIEYVSNSNAEQKIDVLVCYLSGFSTDPKTLQAIRSLKIPMINESLDDERKFVSRKGKDGLYRGNRDICRYFDLCLTTSKSAIIKYLVEGANPVYKPYAANPDIYKKIPGMEKKYDVVFVGARYGIREQYISYLKDNGISVYTAGEDWENGSVSTGEMVSLFNQARIVLGFASVGKSNDIFILKGRDFEVPLTGSFYITQDHDELREYFSTGKNIETYSSREELLKKIRYYLDRPQEREIIASSGFDLCSSKYTSRKSYEMVFGHMGL